jgi:N-acetylglutamate synthase-like GNAT family acetyltransferase
MKIRKATREDCPGMLQLIRELAEYEKAPNEVTVDPKHFEESGFGEKPVWWAFVVENVEAVEEVEVVEDSLSIQPPSTSLNLSQPPSTPSTPSTTSTPSKHIVAFALYYIRYSTWKGQTMYLEDIIVTESMRGKGIGKMLIERLIQEAKEKGFKRITWQVLDWNEPAINFYKKFDAKFDPEWVNVTLEI